MSLIDLVVEDIVKIPLAAKDKPDVLRELVQTLKDAGQIDDFEAILQAVQEREDKMSTGLENGIAVPHGKTTSVSSLKLAIGIAPEGIDFDALDRKPSNPLLPAGRAAEPVRPPRRGLGGDRQAGPVQGLLQGPGLRRQCRGSGGVAQRGLSVRPGRTAQRTDWA